jgi:hypothetical protein
MMTCHILASGLLPAIVDKNGVIYERKELPCSQTFRHSSQENLMVTGNQTEAYGNADSGFREELSSRAFCGSGDQGNNR